MRRARHFPNSLKAPLHIKEGILFEIMSEPKKKKRKKGKKKVTRSSSDAPVSHLNPLHHPPASGIVFKTKSRSPEFKRQHGNSKLKVAVGLFKLPKAPKYLMVKSFSSMSSPKASAPCHPPFPSFCSHTRRVPMETRSPLLASIHTKCCRLTRACHCPPRMQHCRGGCKTSSSCSWNRFVLAKV